VNDRRSVATALAIVFLTAIAPVATGTHGTVRTVLPIVLGLIGVALLAMVLKGWPKRLLLSPEAKRIILRDRLTDLASQGIAAMVAAATDPSVALAWSSEVQGLIRNALGMSELNFFTGGHPDDPPVAGARNASDMTLIHIDRIYRLVARLPSLPIQDDWQP